MAATLKLAEALLRRKELAEKVKQTMPIVKSDVYKLISVRKPVTDGTDDLQMQVPLLTLKQVTQEHDFYARQLREVDAVIQQANWATEVQVPDNVMRDYTASEQVRVPQ